MARNQLDPGTRRAYSSCSGMAKIEHWRQRTAAWWPSAWRHWSIEVPRRARSTTSPGRATTAGISTLNGVQCTASVPEPRDIAEFDRLSIRLNGNAVRASLNRRRGCGRRGHIPRVDGTLEASAMSSTSSCSGAISTRRPVLACPGRPQGPVAAHDSGLHSDCDAFSQTLAFGFNTPEERALSGASRRRCGMLTSIGIERPRGIGPCRFRSTSVSTMIVVCRPVNPSGMSSCSITFKHGGNG